MRSSFESAPQPAIEKLEKEYNIDGMLYKISLVKSKEDPLAWELIFNANDSEAVTNKGLGTFNKVAEAMHDFIESNRQEHAIEKIFFGGSKESTGDQALQESLLEAFQRDPGLFYNFKYEKIEPLKFAGTVAGKDIETFEISEDGIVSAETRYQPTRGITDPFARPIIKKYIDNVHLEEFLSKPLQVAILRRGNLKNALPPLLEHIGINYEEGEMRDGKDPAQQRLNLYERALKQHFPEYNFKRTGDKIEIELIQNSQ